MGPSNRASSGSKETQLARRQPQRPPLPVRMLVASTMTGIGMIALIYLLNPGWGWIEILPDNLPIVGNLDEAGATALLLMVLSYWGVDLTALGKRLGGWSAGVKALPARAGERESDQDD